MVRLVFFTQGFSTITSIASGFVFLNEVIVNKLAQSYILTIYLRDSLVDLKRDSFETERQFAACCLQIGRAAFERHRAFQKNFVTGVIAKH